MTKLESRQQKTTSFSSLDDVTPFMKAAWEKYCYKTSQCKIPSCPLNALMINLDNHINTLNHVLIFGDVIVIEKLGSDESKEISRKD